MVGVARILACLELGGGCNVVIPSIFAPSLAPLTTSLSPFLAEAGGLLLVKGAWPVEVALEMAAPILCLGGLLA